MSRSLARAVAAAVLAAAALASRAAAEAERPSSFRVESVPTALLSKAPSVFVLLPPSYEKDVSRRFPVVYFLHDARGDAEILRKKSVAAALLGDMAEGRLAEMIFVAPGGGGWWVDSWDGREKRAAFLSKELVPWVDARFRTLPERAGRLATGISMGGYGALLWAFREPELFAAVGVLSPAVQQLHWKSVQTLPFFIRWSLTGVFGSDPVKNGLRENDLYDLLLRRGDLARKAPHVTVRCGAADKYRLAEITAFFSKFLTAVDVPNALVLEPGGHDWSYWSRAYPALVASLAGRLGSASAASTPRAAGLPTP